MRHLKGAIVEWVEHSKTKRRAAIRLDRGSMTFWARADEADLQSEPYTSQKGSEVRAWLLKQLAFTTDENIMEWVPVVKIEHGGERRHRYRDEAQTFGDSLSVEIDRFYLGLTRDQREWRKLRWESCDPTSLTVVPENERYAASDRYAEGPKSEKLNKVYGTEKPFRLPSFKDKYQGEETVIPYTPELWAGLLLIVEQMERSRKTLRELVGTKAGIARLAEVGAGHVPLQLMPPKPEEQAHAGD